MKKNFLTAMLFFAFLLIGIQNVSAQSDGVQYVSSPEAMNILTTEINSIESNPIYSQSQSQNSEYSNLVLKLNFYVTVYERISVGDAVPTSIEIGIEESDVEDEDFDQLFNPILQDINGLLSQ